MIASSSNSPRLLLLVLHNRRRQAGWLWAVAIAAGFATGTKYQGALLVGTGDAVRRPTDAGHPAAESCQRGCGRRALGRELPSHHTWDRARSDRKMAVGNGM